MKVCNKAKYASTYAAIVAANEIKTKLIKRGKFKNNLSIYFCKECVCYHLTSKKQINPIPEQKYKIGRGGRKIPITPSKS